jgi:tRNA(Ile)-lysidine synthase
MLPKGWAVSRTKAVLRFDLCSGEAAVVSNYEYTLTVPGIVQVAEAAAWFEAALIPGSAAPGYNPDHMFDPALLGNNLTVRNWRPGDRFWPAHRKSPKKIKELLQERKLTGTERKLWPVVASGREIVWLRGFPAPAQLRPRDGSKQALVIREVGSTQEHD